MRSWKVSVLPASTSAIMAASSLGSAGDCIRSPVAGVGRLCVHVLPILSSDQFVEREFAWTEGKDKDCCGEEGIGVGFVELLRVAEDGEDGFAFRGPEGYEHRATEQESDG